MGTGYQREPAVIKGLELSVYHPQASSEEGGDGMELVTDHSYMKSQYYGVLRASRLVSTCCEIVCPFPRISLCACIPSGCLPIS